MRSMIASIPLFPTQDPKHFILNRRHFRLVEVGIEDFITLTASGILQAEIFLVVTLADVLEFEPFCAASTEALPHSETVSVQAPWPPQDG